MVWLEAGTAGEGRRRRIAGGRCGCAARQRARTQETHCKLLFVKQGAHGDGIFEIESVLHTGAAAAVAARAAQATALRGCLPALGGGQRQSSLQ